MFLSFFLSLFLHRGNLIRLWFTFYVLSAITQSTKISMRPLNSFTSTENFSFQFCSVSMSGCEYVPLPIFILVRELTPLKLYKLAVCNWS